MAVLWEELTNACSIDFGHAEAADSECQRFASMSRAPHSFKQCDLTRAIKAAEAAGIKAYRVEINADGKPVVIVGVGLDKPKKEVVASWDDAIADLERQ
jgi:hypothetical protein